LRKHTNGDDDLYLKPDTAIQLSLYCAWDSMTLAMLSKRARDV